MNSGYLESNNKTRRNQIKSKNKLIKIRCNYFLEKLFNILEKKKSLDLIKYNKKLKKRINININDYKEYLEIYSSIEIEINPMINKFGKFINIKDEDSIYYHIYFNNNKEEIKRNYINKDEGIKIIKIIIDYQIKSFKELFNDCKIIEYIYFKKFYRNNINNMDLMFSGCSSLKEIKGINNFNTINVTIMGGMFQECNELEYLDLSNFNTMNVIDMEGMFNNCYKLKEIKGVNNFNTINVTNMRIMFHLCKELEYLDLSNFNTMNVTDMGWMFNECHKLKEIKNINNFNTINVNNMSAMFQRCKEIQYLDLSNFNTIKVSNMNYMFNQCYKLKEIKGIHSLNLIKVANKIGIFDECNELNSFLKFNNVNINQNSNEMTNKEIENIFTINFISIERKLNYSIPCKCTDIFKDIEKKLYIEYPELKNKNLYFLANGNIINRYETLEKNKIIKNTTFLINEKLN